MSGPYHLLNHDAPCSICSHTTAHVSGSYMGREGLHSKGLR